MRVTLSTRLLVAALAFAAIAGAAVFFATRSRAVQPLGPRLIVVSGGQLTASDPVGQNPWVFGPGKAPMAAPLVCVQAARQNRRHAGSTTLGTCSKNARTASIVVRDIEHPSPETLVFGYMPRSVKQLTVTGPGGARTFRFTSTGHVFGAAFAGRVPLGDLGAVATDTAGRHRQLDLGAAQLSRAPDPAAGTAWLAQAFHFGAGPRRGQTCVHVFREQPRFGGRIDPQTSHPICADLTGSSHFFTIRPIGDRVAVLGVANKRIRQVAVTADGQTPAVRIARKGGAFLAVFDRQRVSPSAIKVTIEPRSGQTATYVGQRNVNVSLLRKMWWQTLPPQGAHTGTIELIPPAGSLSTPFDIWFRPTVPLRKPLDGYELVVDGAAGNACKQTAEWRTGRLTWSSRYNRRNLRQGITLRLLPRRSRYGQAVSRGERWCPGTFRARVVLFRAARAGTARRSQTLQRFQFLVVAGTSPVYRYHGRLVSSTAAARHHLKCVDDVAVCADSMQAALRDALRLGLPVHGGALRIPDASRCPRSHFDKLPPGSAKAAASAALAQAPHAYRGTDLTGMRITRVVWARQDHTRGAYAFVKCGLPGWDRSYVVYLTFPAMRPSASMSQGVVLVGRFRGAYRVWAVLH